MDPAIGRSATRAPRCRIRGDPHDLGGRAGIRAGPRSRGSPATAGRGASHRQFGRIVRAERDPLSELLGEYSEPPCVAGTHRVPMIATTSRVPSPDPAFRTVAKPFKHVDISASASHHILATGPQPRCIADDIDDRQECPLLPQGAEADNLGIPRSDRPPVTSPSLRQFVLGDHPPPVGDRESVDSAWKSPPPTGRDTTPMTCKCGRDVTTAPAKQLGPPGQVDILAVGEEGLVEELALEGDVFKHRPPIHCGRTRRSEDIRFDEIAPRGRQVARPIENPSNSDTQPSRSSQGRRRFAHREARRQASRPEI